MTVSSFFVFQEMLMSRRLPDSHPRQPSSVKRRLFQDGEEQNEAPSDDDDSVERHRRLQMNRESEAENFLNRQVEELDDISRQRWNFDFRNETPINNNGGQWEWNVEVVKLNETNVPKIYLNVLDHSDGEPPDGSSSSSNRNCPTCSKNIKLDNENLSTPTKSTDINESQTPIKKRLVKTCLENLQCSSSKVPKSSSSDALSSPPSVATAVPQTEVAEHLSDESVGNNLDGVVHTNQDKLGHEEMPDMESNNSDDIQPE